MRPVVCLLALLTLAAPAAAQAGGDWTGRWESCWVDGCAILDLTQTGDRVQGTYDLYEGVIDGTVEGRTLTGTWTEPDDGGTIIFTLAPDGQTFFGRDDVGDWWNGGRLPAADDVARASVDDPRDALRSFLIGMNAVRRSGLEHMATAMPALTFALDPEPPPAWDRVERANALFQVLDQTTVRLYDVPHTDLVGRDTAVVLDQLGTDASVRLGFHAADGERWGLVVPSRPALDSLLTVLLRARGDEARLRALLATKGLIGTVPDRHHALGSPRATLRTFMEGFDEGDDGRARIERTMDLSRVDPAVRAQEAPLLADFLRQVILRTGTVVWQQIPDDPASEAPYVHLVHPRGRIVIAPGETEDGERLWRFTPETLGNLRGLYEAMDDIPLADAARQTDDRSEFFLLRDRIAEASPALIRRAGLAEVWQWIALGLLALVAPVLAAGTARLAAGRPAPALDAEADGTTPPLRPRLRWPVRLAVLGGTVLWGVSRLGLPDVLFSPLRAAGLVVLIAGGVGAAWVLVDALSRRLTGRDDDAPLVVDDILVSLTAGVVKIVLVVAGVLLAADALALPYQSVLAGIGIGGLAFAIAAQDTVANLFGSAVIMADRPFRKGDLVRIGGDEGVVEHVGLRSTRLRTLDDSVIVIPNGQLAKETVDNRGPRRARRAVVAVGVEYGTPLATLEAFAQALRETAARHAVAGRPPTVGVWAFGASSIDIEVVCVLRARSPAEERSTRHALLVDIARTAEALGVDFAFPTRTIHVMGPGAPGGDGLPSAPESVPGEKTGADADR